MVKETPARRRLPGIRNLSARGRVVFLFAVSALLGYCVVIRLLTLMQEESDIASLLAQPAFSRLLLVAFCAQLCLVLVAFPGMTATGIKDRLLRSASARSLAFARIVVFSVWLLATDVPRLELLAGLPEPLMRNGAENWLISALPFDPAVVHSVGMILRIAALASLLGLCYRFSSWIVSLCGSYLVLLLYLYEAPFSFALLLVLTLVLACSPAADAYSLEGPFVRKVSNAGLLPHIRYGVPLTLLRLCLAISAFFAVTASLWQTGLAWPLGGGVARELQAAWFLSCRTPPSFRVDTVPVLFQFLGAYEVIVSLLLPCAILSKRLRTAVSSYWLLLQLCNLLLFRTSLPALIVVQLIFIDWDWFLKKYSRFFQFPSSFPAQRIRSFYSFISPRVARIWVAFPQSMYIVFALLLSAAVVFSTNAAPEMLFLQSSTRSSVVPNETVEIIGLAGYRSNGTVMPIEQKQAQQLLSCPIFYSVHRRVAREEDSRMLGLRLAALWETMQRLEPQVAPFQTAQFYRDSYSIVPELRNFNPVDRRLLLDITLTPPAIVAAEQQ